MPRRKKKKSKQLEVMDHYYLTKQLTELAAIYQHVIKALLDSSLSAVCEHIEKIHIKRLGPQTSADIEALIEMGAFDPQDNVHYLGVNVWINTFVFSPFFVLTLLERLSEEEIAQFPPDIKAKHDKILSANLHRVKKQAFDTAYTEFLSIHGLGSSDSPFTLSLCERELPALLGEPNKPGRTYHRLNDLIREAQVLAKTFDKRYFFLIERR